MKRAEQKNYSAPTLGVEGFEVERGFSLSSDYGGIGEAGQTSDYIETDFDL